MLRLSRDLRSAANTFVQFAIWMGLGWTLGVSISAQENSENESGNAVPPTMVSSTLHPGVYADRIVFGQSACMSGPSKELGINYRFGILAGFSEANRRGGVNGRKLVLKTYDDGYEADRAAANALRFAEDNDTLAVIGGTGTPTARRIAPILRTRGIAFIGPFTGANFLRDAEKHANVVNLRASYLDETRVLLHEIIARRGKTRLGIIYQDDAFGRSVLRDFKAVLHDYGLPIRGKSVFTRNSHAVHASVFQLTKSDLEALMLVGTYESNSEIISLFDELMPYHGYIAANLSFVISSELAKRVDDIDHMILVSEVVPSPYSDNVDVSTSFRESARLFAQEQGTKPRINEVALEGYILGRYVTAVLERMGDVDMTRQRFLRTALSTVPYHIDDWVIAFEDGRNAGSKYVRLAILSNGEFVTVR